MPLSLPSVQPYSLIEDSKNKLQKIVKSNKIIFRSAFWNERIFFTDTKMLPCLLRRRTARAFFFFLLDEATCAKRYTWKAARHEGRTWLGYNIVPFLDFVRYPEYSTTWFPPGLTDVWCSRPKKTCRMAIRNRTANSSRPFSEWRYAIKVARWLLPVSEKRSRYLTAFHSVTWSWSRFKNRLSRGFIFHVSWFSRFLIIINNNSHIYIYIYAYRVSG